MTSVIFDRVALIGLGLIGSSLSHVMRREKLAGTFQAMRRVAETRARRPRASGLADEIHESAAAAVKDADLVILCTPVGAYGEVGAKRSARISRPARRQRCRLGQGRGGARCGAAYSGKACISFPAIRSPAPSSRAPNQALPSSSPIAGAFSPRCPAAMPQQWRSLRSSGAPAAPMSRRMDPAHHDRGARHHQPPAASHRLQYRGDCRRYRGSDQFRSDQVLGRRLSRLYPHRRLRSDHVARRLPQQQGRGARNAWAASRKICRCCSAPSAGATARPCSTSSPARAKSGAASSPPARKPPRPISADGRREGLDAAFVYSPPRAKAGRV